MYQLNYKARNLRVTDSMGTEGLVRIPHTTVSVAGVVRLPKSFGRCSAVPTCDREVASSSSVQSSECWTVSW